ncbi:MAG: protein kinase [Chloroflexi bacterium]|nr:protein kinase [Chloroflexota bacterium]
MTSKTIGRYEIKEQLGRGGMATVFRAFDPRFKREVAVKVLPRALMLDDIQFRARFEREAETIAALEHPAIVPVYDFGEEDGQPYLVMRLMTGGSLADRLEEGPLPVSEVTHILERMGAALDRAHGQGIIHRDLKPGNILFDQYNDAFLADFGIARLAESSSTLTGTGIIGTPAYMSPEQIQGNPVDGRTDIYALGIIVFEMLIGEKPYQANTPAMLLVKHMTEPIPRVLDVKPDLPPGCEEVVTRATAKEASDRYDQAGQMAQTLTSSLKRETIKRPITPPSPPTAVTEVSSPPPEVVAPTDSISHPPEAAEMTALEIGRRIPRRAWMVGGVALIMICCLCAVAANVINSQTEADSPFTETQVVENGQEETAATAPAELIANETEIVENGEEEMAVTAPVEPIATETQVVENGEEEMVATTPAEPIAEAAETNNFSRENVTDMEGLLQLGRGSVETVVLSPDGRYLALGGSLGVWVYDAYSLEPVELLQGHMDRVSAVAWSPDSRHIASASWDNTIRIWNVAAVETVHTINGDDQFIALAWSPDGSTLAASTWDSPVELWEAETGFHLGELEGHTDTIYHLAWSPDGDILASAGQDAIRLWDAAEFEETAVLTGYDGEIANLTWSADGSQLISGGLDDSIIRIWTADGDILQEWLAHDYGVYDAVWSPDGTKILSTGDDGVMRLWEAATGRALRELPMTSSTPIRILWLADVNQLILLQADGTILQVDAAEEREINRLREHTAGVWSVAWSPDGELLASGNSDSTVRLWEVATGQQVGILEGHEYGVSAVVWTQDGDFLISGGEDGFVRFWDVAEQFEVDRWQHPDFDGTSALAVAPRAPWLAIADWEGHVWVIDVGNETIVAEWQAHDDAVMQLAWSPEGTELATSGADTAVRIWEAETAELLAELVGHTDVVEDVVWSPDGAHLASAGHDETLRVWEAETAEELWQEGHGDLVMSTAWAPTGFPLASSRYDGAIFLWNPDNGRELHQLYGHLGPVDSMAWSPDGARLASGSGDGTIIIWGLP